MTELDGWVELGFISEPIDLDELVEADLYGRHALFRDPEQIDVWELYSQLGPGEYIGKHRDDGYYDRLAGEPMVLWSPFFGEFIRHNAGFENVHI